MNVKRIKVADIVTDAGTQPRAELNSDYVAELVECLKDESLFEGDAIGVFPAIRVYDDGRRLICADGFHRIEAHKQAGVNEIVCAVVKGDIQDAIMYAVGCNVDHGLRRTQRDKRAAVLLLLANEEWRSCSDNWIAGCCLVSNHLVAKVRAESESTWKNPSSADEPDIRTGRDGKKRNVEAMRAKLKQQADEAVAELEEKAAGTFPAPLVDTGIAAPPEVEKSLKSLRKAVGRAYEQCPRADRIHLARQLREMADELLERGELVL